MDTAGSQDDADEQGDRLLESISRVKRQAIANACEECRRKKVKCDGARPCGECNRRRVQCTFMSDGTETTRQALKRKHGQLNRLYESLQNDDEDRALQMFYRIRAGEDVDAIFRNTGSRSPSEAGDRQRKRIFLTLLLQTTAPLRDIVSLACRALTEPGSNIDLPELVAYEPFRHCVISIEALARAIADVNPDRGSRLLHGAPASFHADDGFDGGPLHWVSAAPWTTIPLVDEAASHLVSVFLALVNGFWRLLEQDLFLRAMRRGGASEFCSPFLVNAVLACASLFSDTEEAFVTPGKRLTRGDHFHREALRVWALESGPPSITNIQALFVMAMDCSLRGKDKMGWGFMTKAVEMHRSIVSLHPLSDQLTDGVRRARQCLAWTVVWMNFSYAMGLLSPFETIDSTLQDAPYDLSLVLPDTVVPWFTYPLAREPIPTRMNMLMQQRCMFNALIADLMRILFSTAPLQRRAKLRAAYDLSKAVTAWDDDLPGTLRYSKKMPVCLFEFHGQYLTLQMTLHNRALEVFRDDDDEPTTTRGNEPPELRAFLSSLRDNALSFARRTARLLRDFREMYGLKITPTAVMHPTAVAASVLLREMKDAQQSNVTASARRKLDSAFEECFRCLLGMGMQNLLPRAIARMIYHSSKHLEVRLPDAVIRMISIVANTAWEPSNLLQLDSVYPNLALRIRGLETAVEPMLDWLQKWERMEDAGASSEG